MATAKKARYTVAEGTQVHFEGVTYEGGKSVPLDPSSDAELVAYWSNAGWITAD